MGELTGYDIPQVRRSLLAPRYNRNVTARSARNVVRMVLFTAIWLTALFGCAGHWDWTRGWLFVAIYVGTMGIMGVVVRRAQPGLLDERSKWRRKDTKPWDRIFLAIFVPLSTFQPAIAGLDVERYHWSHLAEWALYAGILLFLPSSALIAWSLATNRHAESTVRIQTDREHKVVTGGPYRFVRHPMYVGAMLMYPAVALMLGSLWAMAVAALIGVLFICRTALEDRTLRRELAGYQDFAARTRYRLLPGVW